MKTAAAAATVDLRPAVDHAVCLFSESGRGPTVLSAAWTAKRAGRSCLVPSFSRFLTTLQNSADLSAILTVLFFLFLFFWRSTT
jgi:hypothetical protein